MAYEHQREPLLRELPGPESLPSRAMAAAQRVAAEVLETCRQPTLLALRRSALPTTPIRSSRKSELIADLTAECNTPANRQRIFTEVLATWSTHELRLFIAHLKGLGYNTPVGLRCKPADLIAAIVSAERKDICSSAPVAATARIGSKRTRNGICSSAPAVARAPAVSKPAVSDPSAGSSQSVREGACSSAGVAEPPSCMALVALDSAAAPLKLQKKLSRRWSKKWAKSLKKQIRKQKLKRVADETRKAFQEHQTTTTVGELRVMVGQAVGLPLDGKYRLGFDRTIFELTRPPPKKRRARRRFYIPMRSRTESA